MPTNRPFLANLLVAFRAHSAATTSSKAAATATTSSTTTTKSHSSAAATTTTSAAAAAAAAAVQTSNATVQPVFTPSRGRRSSSSSTEGFSEPPSGEKSLWIGGRNSDGQTRYYRLQPVRRHRSYDRMSLDRLSI